MKKSPMKPKNSVIAIVNTNEHAVHVNPSIGVDITRKFEAKISYLSMRQKKGKNGEKRSK